MRLALEKSEGVTGETMTNLSFHEEFYDPQKSHNYYLRIVEDKKGITIKTEKSGVWTWIKSHVLNRNSYKLEKIINVLENNPLSSKDITAIKTRINFTAFILNHSKLPLPSSWLSPKTQNITEALQNPPSFTEDNFFNLGEMNNYTLTFYAKNHLDIKNPRFEQVESSLATGVSGAPIFLVKDDNDSSETLKSVLKVYSDKEQFIADANTMELIKKFEGSTFSFARVTGLARGTTEKNVMYYCLAQSPAQGKSIASFFEALNTSQNKEQTFTELKQSVLSAAKSIADLHKKTTVTTTEGTLSKKRQENWAHYQYLFQEGISNIPNNLLNHDFFKALSNISLEKHSCCIIHGDFQPGNIFFDAEKDHSTFIDLDLCAESIDRDSQQPIGSPAYDVAYFSQWIAVLGTLNGLQSDKIQDLRGTFETTYFESRREEESISDASLQQEFAFMKALVPLKYITLLSPGGRFYQKLGKENAQALQQILIVELIQQQKNAPSSPEAKN